MGTLETVLLMFLVVDAIALGVLVLLQQGKGADIGAAFGSGSANTVFGSVGSASFLAKLTAWLAVAFFLISFALAYFAKERATSLADEGMPTIENIVQPAPESAAPAATEAAPLDAPAQLTAPEETVDSDIPDV
jgi:preprotein translocase subunit SecG